jgi:uncharacterized protein YfaS (alpha-2-macroglobulin family)
MNFVRTWRWLIASMLVAVFSVSVVMSQAPSEEEMRQKATTDMKNGNFNDAYGNFRALCLKADTDPLKVSSDLQNGIQCLQQLARVNEIDELLESTIKAHEKNWRLLQAAGDQYLTIAHHGFMIAGVFERGDHRGGGNAMNSLQRDRIRALQLAQQALPLVKEDDNKHEVAGFYLSLANQLLSNRGFSEAWRLQYLSNLDELPDYEEGWPYYRNTSGAPVDAEGNPIFHKVGKSWEDSTTDGERWRWALEQVVENDPSRLNTVRWQIAQFAVQQFAPTTMQQFGFGRRFFGLPVSDDDNEKNTSGTYALDTLKENETIAKLATGIKRFDLPDDYNYLEIWQKIVAEPKTGNAEEAANALAGEFENRRQYPRAAEWWKKSIAEFGPGSNNWKEPRLNQIVGNWGMFEGIGPQPAGEGASLEFRFRNAKAVKFTAQVVKVEELLADLKAYLKSDPGQLDWQKIQIQNIGWRLVQNNETKYIGEKVADWSLELEPRPKHFDRRVTVSTPLQKGGAYLLTADLQDGNVSKIIVWVADSAIVNKSLDGKNYYFVADAASGAPVAKANLEFFGYHQKHLGGNRWQILTTNFAETADENGQVIPDPRDLKTDYQWLVTARTKDENRFAFLGFQGVWYNRYYDPEYNAIKAFGITDRPVYRPQQEVNFKFWIDRAQYDKDGPSEFAKQSFPVEIFSPKGDKIFSEVVATDEYGGLVGKFKLASDATLGQYSINVQVTNDAKVVIAGGNVTFRVEEYKKPEFEVSVDAPSEPVMLGEKITAKVTAKYYFGSPVIKATVKYRVMRTDHSAEWFPQAPWDWCFGPGYWWFAYDKPWYPGWNEWAGCRRPWPWWVWRGNFNPPELVAEQEVEIGADGTVDIAIDTEVAKELHPNTDHQYTITAEVRDESRRTIVGTGNVLVARKPFTVYSWVDRGYFRVGDTVSAQFLAQTLDRKPVAGVGELTLLKVTYDENRQPVETPVRRWDLNTNSEGRAQQQLAASAQGIYRLSYKVTDAKGHTIEGGYMFTVIGEGFDGRDFRFNDIELIPEKQQYAPGETVKLQINTNHIGSTVLLFVRPTNGIYLPPRVIRMEGKSTVEEIGVVQRDMPNFFVEALTVFGGGVHTETKEIVVPPEKRVINVAIEPSAKEYKPGEKAKVKFRLTDFTGENIVGTSVVSIYDKSVEYISGGTNVADIKDFFWKWRRQHSPSGQTSLALFSGNMTLKDKPGMNFLGAFGATVAEELDAIDEKAKDDRAHRQLGEDKGFGGGGRGGGLASNGAMEEPAAMMADGAMAPGKPMAAAHSGALRKQAADAQGEGLEAGPAGGGDLVEPTVRSNFADTALWVGKIETNKNGEAEVELDMPENLTTWKIRVWSMGSGAKVGSGDVDVVTRKNLIIRLQAPRFFVQKDEVVLSANVHNYLKTDKEVDVTLDIPGDLLSLIQGDATQKVKVKAGGEQRVDWRVKVTDEGTATVRMKALTDEESDATELKLPCYIHGMLKTEAWAGTVRPDQDSAHVTINVPAERRVEQSVLEIRYSPTLAGAMVDALPYLADFPYGCTEQTLNRFLPSVITQKVLREMDTNLEDVQKVRTNLNAQELGDARERAKQWKRFDRNPVFDQDELNRMVKDGVTALTNMQNADGGWGWFSGRGEQSWPHTTAIVVHGLQIAQENDVAIVPDMLDRGVAWLKNYQALALQELKNAPAKKQPWKAHADNLDAFVYMVLVDAGQDNVEMRDFLYRDRIELAVYAKALFGLALHKLGDQEKLDMIMQNIDQFLVQDTENETAYLKLPQNNFWWFWWGSETEANAYYLKLLARMDPQGERAPRLVKYLLNNRKHATYWSSTRDTAIVVESFAEFIRKTGENKPDMVVEVWLDGKKQQEVAIKPENLFTFNNKFVLTGADVTDGKHEIEIKRRGQGPVYFNAYLTNFTLEDPITKAGLEIKVERHYYRLKQVDKEIKVAGSRGQVADQKVLKYEREELQNLDTLKSGDLVEIELVIESKNDYEYILFEDMKAAGFEPVEVRSGYSDNGLRAYMELRDERVAFFVRVLPRGKHSVAYRMRAEIPGRFSALPTKASAMYAPELKGNSDEIKLKIED